MRSPAAGSTGAQSTRSVDGFVRREEAVHQLRVDRLDDRRGVGRGVLRRHAEQHRVVTELEVGVDRARPGPGSASRAARRGWSRRRSCRRRPWWRTRRRSCPSRAGLGRRGRGARHDARHGLADPLDRLADLALAGVDRRARRAHRRAARPGADASVSSSASSTTPTSGKLRAMRCTAASPSASGEARAEHDDGGFARHEVARDLFDGR